MMARSFILLTAFFLVSISAALAQMPDHKVELQKTEMKKFQGMIGVWEGDGWIKQGSAETLRFRGMETVQWKLDGTAVLVEGLHKAKTAAGADTEKIIHETLAVITFEPNEKLFRFRTFLAAGSRGLFEIKAVSADTFEWGFDTPNGKIKYIIKTANGIWSETGEFSGDGGKTWLKFFEMNLKKRN